MTSLIGVDTNVLLRFAHQPTASEGVVSSAIRRLRDSGWEFCFSPQNIREFWNVSTRPVDRNGFGLSPERVPLLLKRIEESMTLLDDDPHIYQIWRRLVVEHNIKGVQVHDAHLAASLEAYGVGHLLTMNSPDFKRYSRLTSLDPNMI